MVILNYASYIDDAHILLAYIAKEGKTVDAEAIKVILEFKGKLEEEVTDNDIILFWRAYNTLVKLALPANIEMIKANVKYVMPDGKSSIPLSERIVKRYSRMTFITLIVILFMQVYWIIGKNIVNQSTVLMKETLLIEKKEQEILAEQYALHIEMEELRKQKKEIANIFYLEEDKLDRLSRSLRTKKFKVATKIKEMDTSLAYTTGGILFPSLKEKNKVKEDAFLTKNIEVKTSKKFTIPLLEFQIILNDMVYQYLLPMLFGLLGACVYILRQLSLQIETLTFTSSNMVKFQLRLYLGTIAGLTFSWLFPVMDIDSVFVASPLAVAFIVGYSIEVLFVALDKIINTLNGNEDMNMGKLK